MFENLSFLIPGERLYETSTLVAFNHPSPDYPTHILIVPKRAITSLIELDQADDGFQVDFLRDLIQCLKSLVMKSGLEQRGYRLIANGGAFQDVPQLHFHLISDFDSGSFIAK